MRHTRVVAAHGSEVHQVAFSGDHLKALVQRHIDGDEEGFYSIATQLAARAARSGRTKFAQELQSLITSARDRRAAPALKPTPLAQPRGELAGLMTVQYPTVQLGDMTLEPQTQTRLRRVITEQRQRDRLEEHALTPIHRVLLLGPPGTGKSMSAAMLAHELSLPLFTIQLDALMSKYMGETAAKLRLIFDAAASTRAVYLFDEFDALGGQRTFGNDVGEARRVLNSFLQFLDAATADSLVVAATNHPELLDRALYRRFDSVIEFVLPEVDAALDVIRARMALMDTSSINWSAVRPEVRGLSHADLVRAAESAAKNALLRDDVRVDTESLVASLRERRRQADG